MRYRVLGKTGLTVSEIGFGGWGIGGSSGRIPYGPTDRESSLRALKRALDLGVTFYDTSGLYGEGQSETLMGQVLRDVRGRVVVASKVGFPWEEGVEGQTPQAIRESLEGSLRRLQTDYIDLYQLHSPPAGSLVSNQEGILKTLSALQREGKIRAFGVSVRSPNDGKTVVEQLGIKAIQANLNLIDQRALENGLLDLCLKEGTGFIARTPLCFGFLAGRYTREIVFAPEDHRSKWPREQIEQWTEAYSLFAPLFREEKATPVQIALRFCLSHPGVSTVIPGMLTEGQAEENVRASDMGPLSAEQFQEVQRIYQEHTFMVAKR